MKIGFNQPCGFRGGDFETVETHTRIHTYGRPACFCLSATDNIIHIPLELDPVEN